MFLVALVGGDITVLRIQAEQEEAKTREDTKIKALEGELVWNLSIQPCFLEKVEFLLIFFPTIRHEMEMKLGNIRLRSMNSTWV